MARTWPLSCQIATATATSFLLYCSRGGLLRSWLRCTDCGCGRGRGGTTATDTTKTAPAFRHVAAGSTGGGHITLPFSCYTTLLAQHQKNTRRTPEEPRRTQKNPEGEEHQPPRVAVGSGAPEVDSDRLALYWLLASARASALSEVRGALRAMQKNQYR